MLYDYLVPYEVLYGKYYIIIKQVIIISCIISDLKKNKFDSQ